MAVTLGTALMHARSARRLDELEMEMQAEVTYLEALQRRHERGKAFQAKLDKQFDLAIPALFARIMGTTAPGTEFLGESLLGQFLESLTEEQVTAIVKLLQDAQKLWLFQLYEMYRKRWKKRQASASEEGSGSANEAGGGEGLGDAP
jgi:hypothetical protein